MLFNIDPQKLRSLLDEAKTYLGSYALGFKVEPIDLQGPELIGTNPQNGERRKGIDCSGFTRWAIYHATGGKLLIPDGSVMQHEWADRIGLTKLTPKDGHASDGSVMIAFLAPEATHEGIGHVLLTSGGETFESHGGKGPDSRDWGALPWMSQMAVYLLSGPKAAVSE